MESRTSDYTHAMRFGIPRSCLRTLGLVTASCVPLVALVAMGCASAGGDKTASYPRYFDGAGHHDPDFGTFLAAPHAAAPEGALLGDDWTLTSHYPSVAGLALVPVNDESARAREIRRRFPGVRRSSLERLRFANRRTAAVIWSAAVPVLRREVDLHLRVFGDRLLDGVSFGDHVVTTDGFSRRSERASLATRVLARGDVSLGGMPAHLLTFEVADVDQLRLTPDSRWRRVSVVIARTAFAWPYPGRRRGRPVLFVFGVESSPRDFDEAARAFASLLSRFEFGSIHDGVRAHAAAVGECIGLLREPRSVELELRVENEEGVYSTSFPEREGNDVSASHPRRRTNRDARNCMAERVRFGSRNQLPEGGSVSIYARTQWTSEALGATQTSDVTAEIVLGEVEAGGGGDDAPAEETAPASTPEPAMPFVVDPA